MQRRQFLSAGACASVLVAAPFGGASAQESTQNATEIDTSRVLEMALGAEDAPVTMIEYASFTCPHCQSFHENAFPSLKAEYIDAGKLRFIYREVYFDRYGLWAGMVARCGGPEKYFAIVDILYERQREWLASSDPAEIADNLRTIGRVAGLSEDALEACLADGDLAQEMVAVYQKNALADDINSTPSFVIDGQKYQNMNYADMSAIIDARLGG